jgi:hypothetical protein
MIDFFFRLHGGLHLTAAINFLFASRQYQFHSAYMVIHTSRRYQFFLCLMAVINFSLPHGNSSTSWTHLKAHYLFGLSATIIFFGFFASAFIFCWHLEFYHLLLALQVPSSSFGLAFTAYFFIGFTVAPL